MFLYFPHIRSLYSTHFCTPGEGEDNVSLLNIMCTINDRPSPELPRVKTVHQPKENKTKQKTVCGGIVCFCAFATPVDCQRVATLNAIYLFSCCFFVCLLYKALSISCQYDCKGD